MTTETRLNLFLCGLVSIGSLAMVIYLPSMPGISQSLHSNAQNTELTLTLYMLTFGLSQLIYGPLSDHFGRRPIILLGCGLYVLFSLVSALAPNIEILLVARALEGIGAGGITALARAAVNDVFTGKKLTAALSNTSIAASLGVMLSPIIGGYLQVYFNWRANFYFLALYATAFWLITWLWFKETKPITQQPPQAVWKMALWRYTEVLRNRPYVFYMLSGSVCFMGSAAYYVVSPFLYQHTLGVSPQTYGYFFLFTSGCFIIGGFSNKWLHLYEKARLLGGNLLLALAAIFMLSLGLLGHLSILSVLLPMALYMFALGIVFPSTMIAAVRRLKNIAGTAAAVMGCCQVVAAAAATAIMAHLPQTNQTPLGWMLLSIAIVSAILSGIALTLTTRETTG